MAYGDGSHDAERDAIPTRVRVYSLDGEPLGETTVDLTPGEQDDTIAVRVDQPSSSLTVLERGVHVPLQPDHLLAEREDESGMVVVGKGTIKRMDHQDVDERGLWRSQSSRQPYDLILPESPLKGASFQRIHRSLYTFARAG